MSIYPVLPPLLVMALQRGDKHGPHATALQRHNLLPMLQEESEAGFYAHRVKQIQKSQLPKPPPRIHNRHVFEEPEPPQKAAAKAAPPSDAIPPALSQSDIFESS